MPRQLINDGLSRQRRWQLKKMQEGRCQECGKKKPDNDDRAHCDVCAIRSNGSVKRQTTPAQWKAVDWTALTNVQIARQLNRNPQTVGKARRKYGCPREDWAKQIDPQIPADVLSKKFGKTIRTIHYYIRKQKSCA